MQSLNDFITQEHLSMSAKWVDDNPNMNSEQPMAHWLCHIAVKNGDEWPVYFSMGLGHQGNPPELADVLDCLASDAAGFENDQDFEEWANEYGYDTDSRKAETIYRAIDDQINGMKAFLGETAYETLLWETKRE